MQVDAVSAEAHRWALSLGFVEVREGAESVITIRSRRPELPFEQVERGIEGQAGPAKHTQVHEILSGSPREAPYLSPGR
jgi:hypothetical protein